MLSIVVNHWIMDIGLSKLFDNIINNFRADTGSKLEKEYRDVLIFALYSVIEGYPSPTISPSDYSIIIDCVKTMCVVSPEGEKYLLEVLSSIKV